MSGSPLHSEGAKTCSRSIQPLYTLQAPHGQDAGDKRDNLSVSAICFLGNQQKSVNDGFNDSDTASNSDYSDDDEELSLRCWDIVTAEHTKDHDPLLQARSASASLSMRGLLLASSHSNGDSFVWDLGQRRIASNFCDRRGPGLAFRNMGGNRVFLHTRDTNGTVSVHNVEKSPRLDNISGKGSAFPVVAEYETKSLTFCAASPCYGNSNLLAMPQADECYVAVRDLRISPNQQPVTMFHGAGLSPHAEQRRPHGMLSSLAMSESLESSSNPVLACGMESGSIFFHDLRLTGSSPPHVEEANKDFPTTAEIKLGRNPILSLDLIRSSLLSETSKGAGSVVTIAGMAGDSSDLLELPETDRGTVGVMKATFPWHGASPKVRLRARLSTCSVGSTSFGKPGVAICRFRPDGRIFAVGGWDTRLRIFDRAGDAAPLALLKGHTDSVTAVDWLCRNHLPGLLATGAGDGRICLWRCFDKPWRT